MGFKKRFAVEISSTAHQDIDNAIMYYRNHSKKAARMFYENTFKTIGIIRKNPYYEVRFDQYRALKVHKFPFLIIFRVDDRKGVVYVITVFNTYRNPDAIKFK